MGKSLTEKSIYHSSSSKLLGKTSQEKSVIPKHCDKCGHSYYPRVHNQRLCQNPCTLKFKTTIQEKNEQWLLRETIKISKKKNPFQTYHYEL